MKTEKRRSPIVTWFTAGLLLLGGVLLPGLTGCCPGNAVLEQDYGRSVHHNLAQQVLNPRAGVDTSPAVGLTPSAAANEMDRYNKSFKGEEKKTLEMKLTTPSY
jgi:hypothetical protein